MSKASGDICVKDLFVWKTLKPVPVYLKIELKLEHIEEDRFYQLPVETWCNFPYKERNCVIFLVLFINCMMMKKLMEETEFVMCLCLLIWCVIDARDLYILESQAITFGWALFMCFSIWMYWCRKKGMVWCFGIYRLSDSKQLKGKSYCLKLIYYIVGNLMQRNSTMVSTLVKMLLQDGCPRLEKFMMEDHQLPWNGVAMSGIG